MATFVGDFPSGGPLRSAIEAARLADETDLVDSLIDEADVGAAARKRINATATKLVGRIRAETAAHGGLDALMHEYDLSNQEGVVLMCLAEALLRVPDGDTADRLIADKLGGANWEQHLGHSESMFVNASTWALMLTGRLIRLEEATVRDAWSALRRLVSRSGEPIIRQAMIRAMRIIGRQFVMGQRIETALERARADEAHGYLHSYDMLGEAAHTAADAAAYQASYLHAIKAVGAASAGRGPLDGPGVSIKLSALHPRFEMAQHDRVIAELLPRVMELAHAAKAVDIGLCIDTEEADRLEPTLDVVERVVAEPGLAGWSGFGLAIQAYQRRAVPLIDWLADLARRHDRRLAVRLVKGAYWDAEIKQAQEQGLESYPVFTRKPATDVSYIACARRLLAAGDAFYPQFATHNAHTVATVLELAGNDRDGFEFQRLHGMGEALYRGLIGSGVNAAPERRVRCRVYAPVGSHEDLLAYLVRRLLENGANNSFVNRIVDETLPIAEIVADPVAKMAAFKSKPHPEIPVPSALYGPSRRNARGLDLSDPATLRTLAVDMAAAERDWSAEPLVAGRRLRNGATETRYSPADLRLKIGEVHGASHTAVAAAVTAAETSWRGWDKTPAEERAACLERAADAFEAAMPEMLALLVREGGKTLPDGVAEVREGVDFLRYYAVRARTEFAEPEALPGPTGESNRLSLRARGVFACISPWNFPLAIFTGQVAAALAAGNAVVAKPAEQTPLIAYRAVQLLHEAGVPGDVLNLVLGDGHSGAVLVDDPRVGGIAFTGSVEVAHLIQRALAARTGPIVPLIAETGGLNAMIVDSTALPEQVVEDVVTSAFRSCGQRCSALRVLFVQADVAPRIEELLAGAMAELRVGDPALLSTDVGPVIDGDAKAGLEAHAAHMGRQRQALAVAPVNGAVEHGTFFAPRAFRIERMEQLEREVFGPILHVIPYAASRIESVLDAIDRAGYGLTLGIHSRVDGFARAVAERVRVGNCYINRNMIGAVVGVQPFGGEGLSGTGPKAGGPRYLHRFATERTLTINTTASGGNALLMSLAEEDQ